MAVVAEAAEAVVVVGETLPLQEDRPRDILEEENIDSLDNRQTYSPGIAQRRKSSSRNGNSTII